MTDDQKLLAEKLIMAYKANKEIIDWEDFDHELFGVHYQTLFAANSKLLELELVRHISGERYMLTEKGSAFKNWKQFFKERRLYSSAKKNKAFQERFWYLWPFIGFGLGIIYQKYTSPSQVPQSKEYKLPSENVSPAVPDTLHKK